MTYPLYCARRPEFQADESFRAGYMEREYNGAASWQYFEERKHMMRWNFDMWDLGWRWAAYELRRIYEHPQ